jgi:ferric-dicitrate binding protein FerR (iron transport regulator)
LLENNNFDTISLNNTKIKITSDSIKYATKKSGKVLEYNELYIPRGAEYVLNLEDGTTAFINSESWIKYPQQFSKNIRKVYVKGEVYFKVAKNKAKAFVVDFKSGQIEVVGTEFNFRNYPDEDKIITSLTEGKIIYKAKNIEKNIIAGEEVVHVKNGKIEKHLADTQQASAWIRGRYVFRHKAIYEVMKDLERWYNLKVFYQNESVKWLKITGNLKRYEDFNHFAQMLQKTQVAKFSINNNIVTISAFE